MCLGWINGTILVDRPWKKPTLKYWLSLTNFYAIFITISHYIFFISSLHFSFAVTSFVKPTNKYNMQKIIVHMLHSFCGVATIARRIYLWTIAKQLVSFKNRLESYPLSNNRRFSEVPSSWKLNIFSGILVMLRIGAAVFEGMDFAKNGYIKYMWFARILNYDLLLGFAITLMVLRNLALFIDVGIVVTTAAFLLNVICDFCAELESYYTSDAARPTTNNVSINQCHNSATNDRSIWMISEEQLVKRIEEIKSLFKTFDEIFGPMLFFLIIISFVSLVNGINSTIINDGTNEFLVITHILLVLSEFAVLFLMELGHAAHRLVSIVVPTALMTLKAMLKVPFSEAIFQPIWMFDSILEIGSFSPARQKLGFSKICSKPRWRIIKILKIGKSKKPAC